MAYPSETQPKPGEGFKLNGNTFIFPSGKLGVPYEVGKAARVYQIIKNSSDLYALKAFFPDYRTQSNAINAKALSNYEHLPGLTIANRDAITVNQKAILQRYPQFENAILMPWVLGESWQNYILGKKKITPEQSLSLARELAAVVSELEEKGLAHCDLSNGNFVFSPDFTNIELVDIEEMYAKEFQKPDPVPVGSDGYAPLRVVNDGYYGPEGDRFALGILLVEILCWQFEDVRETREDMALFASDEFGHNSKRYKLVKQRLSEIPKQDEFDPEMIIKLFDKVWLSRWKPKTSKEERHSAKSMYAQCPKASVWKKALGSRIIDFEKDPVLDVSSIDLNFGPVTPDRASPHSLSISIVNQGGGTLSGKIIAEPWLLVTPSLSFALPKNQPQTSIRVSLNPNFPKHPNGGEYKFPKGLIIQSNGGVKIVGVRYSTPKPPFYKKWLGWILLFLIGVVSFGALVKPNTAPVYTEPVPVVSTRVPTKTKVPPTPTPAPMGVKAKDERYEVSVVTMRKLSTVYLNKEYTWYPKEGYAFLELGVKVKNVQISTAEVSWKKMRVIESNKDQTYPTWVGGKAVADGIEINPKTIVFAPVEDLTWIKDGENAQGAVVFDQKTIVFPPVEDLTWIKDGENAQGAVVFDQTLFLRLIYVVQKNKTPSIFLFSFDDSPLVEVTLP